MKRSDMLDTLALLVSLYLLADGVTGGKLTRWVEGRLLQARAETAPRSVAEESPVYGVAREAERILKGGSA